VKSGRSLSRDLGYTGAVLACGYMVLSMADMACSLFAFSVGVPEMNPLLAWMAERGCFVPAKVGLSAVVGAMMVWMYGVRRGRVACWGAVIVMAGVNVYHVWGFSKLFYG
jgi:hypothetical protein